MNESPKTPVSTPLAVSMTADNEHFTGTRFNGQNPYGWEQSVLIHLGLRGLAWLARTDSTPPVSPLDGPVEWGLADPDYTNAPRAGVSQWEEQGDLMAAAIAVNGGWRDRDTFSTIPASTIAGMTTRLSTTNDLSLVKAAMTDYVKQLKEYETQASKAAAIIRKSIAPGTYDRLPFREGDSAKTLFDKVMAYAKDLAKSQKHQLKTHFEHLSRKKGESIDDFAARIRDAAKMVELASPGRGSDDDMLHVLLEGCRPQYGIEVRELETDTELTFDEAAKRLRTYEMAQQRGNKDKDRPQPAPPTTPTAFVGQQGGKNQCFNCQGYGHIAKVCPSPRPDDKGKEKGDKPDGKKGDKTVKFGNDKKAGKSGDSAKDGKAFVASSASPRASLGRGIGPRETSIGALPEVAAADGLGCAATMAVRLNPHVVMLILDSGAAFHMTSNEAAFDSLRPASGHVTIADGTRLDISGVGTAKVWALNGDGEWELLFLNDCRFVPDLHPSYTLVSIKAMALNHGLEVALGPGNAIVRGPDGKVFFRAPGPDSDFTIQAIPFKVSPTRPVAPSGSAGSALAARSTPESRELFRLWHFRLGHASLSAMHKLARSDMLRGVDTSTWTSETLDFCEPCVVAKARRGTFQPNDKRREVPLDLVHCDLSGRLPKSAWNQEYYMALLDDATHYGWVSFLKEKSEAAWRISNWYGYALHDVDYQHRLNDFQTDRGREFDNERLRQFLQHERANHRMTAAYSSESNGRIERYNQTIGNMARALLAAAGLPKRFWHLAVEYAVYLLNRTPTAALDGKTPYEAIHKEKPDVSNLRTFGCAAYKLVRNGRTKLADKTKKMFYVGLDPKNTRTYLLLETSTGHVHYVNENDVTFNEGSIAGLGPADRPKRLPDSELFAPLDSASDSNESIPAEGLDSETDLDVPDLEDADTDSDSGDDDDDDLWRGRGAAPSGSPATNVTPERAGHGGARLLDGPATPQDVSAQRDAAGTGGGLRRSTRAGAGRLADPNRSVDDRYFERVRHFAEADAAARNLAGMGLWLDDSDGPQAGVLDASDFALALAAGTDDDGVGVIETRDDPSYKEAMAGPERELWLAAMVDENLGLIENGTFEVVDKLPPGRLAILGKDVLKKKRGSDGSVARYKDRQVARGFTQREGIDYHEVFAPVTRYSTVRYLASLLVDPDIVARHTDVKLAYLNGELREDIYYRPPPSFIPALKVIDKMPDLAPATRASVDALVAAANKAIVDGNPLVLRLRKPLYGLKQAGFEWNRRLDTELQRLGYRNFPSDPCLYVKVDGDSWVKLAIYVDDFFWVSNDRKLVDGDIAKLQNVFKISDLGEPEWFLGLRIRRGSGFVTVDQEQYTVKMLDRFGMTDCRPLGSPADPSEKPDASWGPRTEQQRKDMAGKPYAELVGSLMFLANGTRPDIQAAVGFLARHMSNPGQRDWLAGKRVLRYLQGTKGVGIRYSLDPETSNIVGYADADWASDLEDRRSTSGYVFLRAGGAISWQSRKQPTPALSSTESELFALTAAFKEALSWRNRLESIGFPIAGPTKILCDNQGALALIRAPAARETTKHIAIRSFFARDAVDRGLIAIKYVNSANNAADALTKALNPDAMRKARDQLGLVEVVDAERSAGVGGC